jgi:hypothetical protein
VNGCKAAQITAAVPTGRDGSRWLPKEWSVADFAPVHKLTAFGAVKEVFFFCVALVYQNQPHSFSNVCRSRIDYRGSGPASIGEGCVVEGAGLNVVVMPPIEQKAAAQAALSVPAVRALAVQRVDSRGVFARRLVGVGAGRPEQQQRADSSWLSDIGVFVRASARNACGPLFVDTPCAQHNRRTPEPRASSTSGIDLFPSVAIAICAAARQITR